MDVKVRKAELGDKEQLVELMLEFGRYTREKMLRPLGQEWGAGAEWMMDYADERGAIEKDLEKYLTQAEAFFLVAEVGGKLAGFINGDVRTHPLAKYSREGYIHDFFVTRELRGQDVGRGALWPAAMAELEARQCDFLSLEVFVNNTVKKFYEEQGFKECMVEMIKPLRKEMQ
jgi:ribosomal protein S18 acetylase RimI-like enzyme